MSDFRFGVDDYSLNYHPHDVSDGWDGTAPATLGNAGVDDALALLDEANEQGRIEYEDYSQLHDAIATLGRGECEECARTAKKMLEIANEMRHIGASSMTPHQLFCCWAHDIERAVKR